MKMGDKWALLKLAEKAKKREAVELNPHIEDYLAKLEMCGLVKVLECIKSKVVVSKGRAVAYEHYKYVTPKNLDDFEKSLNNRKRLQLLANLSFLGALLSLFVSITSLSYLVKENNVLLWPSIISGVCLAGFICLLHYGGKVSERVNKQKEVKLTPLREWDTTPPEYVLDNVVKAKKLDCFSEFVVAHVQNVPDPIVFGMVKDCKDLFYISQWGDDLKIEDVIKENEG